MDEITISNGEEFFRIPVADLDEAKADGFFVPGERGLTLVSNGEEVFEVPLDDVADATAEGYRDLLIAEREQWSATRRKAKRLPSTARRVKELTAAPQTALVEVGSVSIQTDSAEPEAAPVTLQTHDVQPELPNEPVEIKADAEDASESFNAAETARIGSVAEAAKRAIEQEEAERRRFQQEELKEATGARKCLLFVKYRMLPDEEVQKNFMTTYGSSTIAHVVVLLILGLWILKGPDRSSESIIDSRMTEAVKPTEDEPEPVEVEVPELNEAEEPTEIVSDEISDMQLDVDISDLKPANIPLDIAALGPAVNVSLVGPLAGRSKAGRKSLVTKYGGTAGSETAVNAALNWLSRHQNEDGSWSFDHSHVGCDCAQPGTHPGKTGSTGFALLTLMGAGQSFCDGDYRGNIEAGIRYLLNNMNLNSAGYADLRGGPQAGNGGIYCHGLATSAVCEALAMNSAYKTALRDGQELNLENAEGRKITYKDLVQNEVLLSEAAQLAINYTVHHQSPTTGGFGYAPKSGGDTSILGWQIMGLTSGKMARLQIPTRTWTGCVNYLNSVQQADGAYYGYSGPAKKDSTTAIGLLCRMYQGWSKSRPAFVEGVKYLSKLGPAPNNMYYNYYATQVIFHWGDDGKENLWTKWNDVMREQLVRTQSKAGHASGSWNIADAHGAAGGRLYMTCLSAMTLEIYYRKLPIYKKLEGPGAKPGEKP